MSERPPTNHDARIDSQLRSVHQRLAMRGIATTWRSPDIEAIEKEEEGVVNQAAVFFGGIGQDEQRLTDFRQMFTFVFAKGPDPRATLQRSYAIAQALFPELLGYMSKSDVGRMFDETKAAASWRTKQIFAEKKCVAPGARGAEVRDKNAAAARRRHEQTRARRDQRGSPPSRP